jgi:hypothetical protein
MCRLLVVATVHILSRGSAKGNEGMDDMASDRLPEPQRYRRSVAGDSENGMRERVGLLKDSSSRPAGPQGLAWKARSCPVLWGQNFRRGFPTPWGIVGFFLRTSVFETLDTLHKKPRRIGPGRCRLAHRDFREQPTGEVRGMNLPRTRVNKDVKKGRCTSWPRPYTPAPSFISYDSELVDLV